MNHDTLVMAIAGGLLAAFALGWLAGWLTLRAGGDAARAAPAAALPVCDQPAQAPVQRPSGEGAAAETPADPGHAPGGLPQDRSAP